MPEATIAEMPKTEYEKRLALIWGEVLKINEVGVHHNFFDLGGNSLRSIQVITRIEKEFGVRINPREFTYQTLGQIANSLEYRNHSEVLDKKSIDKEVFLGSFKKAILRFMGR